MYPHVCTHTCTRIFLPFYHWVLPLGPPALYYSPFSCPWTLLSSGEGLLSRAPLILAFERAWPALDYTNQCSSLSIFLSFFASLPFSPFWWKRERLRYRWSSRVSVWNYIFTTICIYCRVSTTRQVVLSRRKKINYGIIYGRNGELMVNNKGS